MKLTFKNLSKSYGLHCVLDGINLSLNDVSSIGVIGPSGGGKSTLLRLIGGLEHIDGGEIIFNSFTLDSSNIVEKMFRKKVGIVFQSYSLFPHLSALDNITLVLIKVHKLQKEEGIAQAESLLRRFALFEHKDKKPHQLSGGQQQRIAIVRVLAINAELVLFDEPTSALDPILTAEVLEMIEDLKQEDRKDFIIVTHHMGFANQVADYLLFVDNTKIIEHGLPHDLFNKPQTPELKFFLSKTLEWNTK